MRKKEREGTQKGYETGEGVWEREIERESSHARAFEARKTEKRRKSGEEISERERLGRRFSFCEIGEPKTYTFCPIRFLFHTLSLSRSLQRIDVI